MNTENLPFREKVAYGFGDLASVLYWQTFMAYILLFRADVFGITAAAAGTMLCARKRPAEEFLNSPPHRAVVTSDPRSRLEVDS